MSHYKNPIVLMSLGLPGSGKSYFMRSLSEKLNTIRINSDSMRRSIFGSIENMEKVRAAQGRDVLNDYTFGALDYVADQIISKGNDLIYDAQFNQIKHRAALAKLAESYGATAIVVHIDTPVEVALARGQSRETTIDQRQQSEERMSQTIDRHLQSVEMPSAIEKVIKIDGQQPFDKQFVAFEDQLEKLL